MLVSSISSLQPPSPSGTLANLDNVPPLCTFPPPARLSPGAQEAAERQGWQQQEEAVKRCWHTGGRRCEATYGWFSTIDLYIRKKAGPFLSAGNIIKEIQGCHTVRRQGSPAQGVQAAARNGWVSRSVIDGRAPGSTVKARPTKSTSSGDHCHTREMNQHHDNGGWGGGVMTGEGRQKNNNNKSKNTHHHDHHQPCRVP